MLVMNRNHRRLMHYLTLVNHVVSLPFTRLKWLAQAYGVDSTKRRGDLMVAVYREMVA